MRKALIAGLAVVAMGGTGLVLRLAGERTSTIAAENPAPPPVTPGVPVTAGIVTAADVPVFVNGIGSVQAYNTVTIKSRVDGQIVNVGFTEGQNVKKGASLFQIDPRPYQAALDQASASKQKDEAQLASAQADLARYAQLVPSGFQTKQSYDQQKATVGQVQAAIKADEAQIEAAQLNLGYADIRAPIDGRLGARLVDIGNMVRATDAAGLVTITQVKPIFVSFTVPQEQAHKVRERQAQEPLKVLAYGNDNQTLLGTGKLTLIDNAIDQATGTIRLKATFDNADERLWPGEFANVRVVLNTRRGVPTVPAQSVMDGPTGKFAYVIKQDGTVERREVAVTALQDGVAVIEKGLSPGDKIVIEGQYRLTNGARVRVETNPGASG
jgi:multidrug efflux system membrane fusion protein